MKSAFQNPPAQYRTNYLLHRWPENRKDLMDAFRDYGYRGVVTNVPPDNGFTSNPDNLDSFADILDELDAKGLSYWIYDEVRYPSGRGGGLTLEGHPELAAKGFFMYRRMAYEPVHAKYHLPDEAEKIIWAAKYPVASPNVFDSVVQFDRMEPVPFTKDFVECDLKEMEILYVFSVKDAYEGSHSTHNIASHQKNINIMDKRAVARFIECVYEPMVKRVPDSFRRALNVFTDEPGLQVAYIGPEEVWPFALAPWVDGLFEAYEAEYGHSILPQLPLLFEGGSNAYPVRIRFYELVGKLIAEAWSEQLSDWCEAHGCGFSGHYIAEEFVFNHVKHFGNFIKVLCAASYPGIDLLQCYPEDYWYETPRYAQMAIRKKGTNGMMVEICPYAGAEIFAEDPLNNMAAVMGMLYMAGCRVTHSYFKADFSGWKDGRLADVMPEGLTNEAETNWFNEYVGRLGLMLDGLHNCCDTYIYYGIEDTQAKTVPEYTGAWNTGDHMVTDSTGLLMRAIMDAGRDFYMIDRDDLREAAEKGTISGNPIKRIFVPSMDVIYGESLSILEKLAENGVEVRFLDQAPTFAAEDGSALQTKLPVCDLEAVKALVQPDEIFPKAAENAIIHRAVFKRGGEVLYFLVNRSRTDGKLLYHGTDGEIWNPEDGSVTAVAHGEAVTVPAMRALFIVAKD